ncbi:Lrp/AsnC ligand binding domain-containing protein [Kibdelosporangium lantanae]|uniref:Lrp/AsnC ligand binding domain-containing protein n=1 Tax=Kibdelosporangium lantanae TaxID=1497396 RepID=A0ABW3MF93_9PSEU
MNVNLATGNVTTSVMSQFMMTGFGPQFVQFTYNSLTANSANGLVGAYFAGAGDSIADNEQPVAVRTDPEVSFVAVTTGTTNLTAAVNCRDNTDLYRFLTERVASLDAIDTLESAPVIRTVKRAGALLPMP